MAARRLSDGVEVAHGSVQDPASLAEAMAGVDAVVHLVGIIRERRPSTTFAAVNHGGTRNVAEAARAAGVKHVVYVSALGARDDAGYPYARSKWQGEQEVMGSGVPYTILRPSILFGEGDEFFNTLAALVKMLPLVPVAGSGANRFQPIAADDVARCVATAVLQEAYHGRVIEVGGPRHYTYRELLRVVANVLGVRQAAGPRAHRLHAGDGRDHGARAAQAAGDQGAASLPGPGQRRRRGLRGSVSSGSRRSRWRRDWRTSGRCGCGTPWRCSWA